MRETDPEQRLIELIANAKWLLLTKRLIAFAEYYLARFEHASGPRGQKATEYVTRAVVEVLSGTYPPEGEESLFHLIARVVAGRICRDFDRRR